MNRLGLQLLDGIRGLAIHALGCRVIVVMAEIGADHDERFWPTPKSLQYLRNFGGTGVANNQWHQLKLIEHLL